MMHNLHVTQVQMDEPYALLGEVGKAGERKKCWVWVAIDPISKLLLAIEVGDRDLRMAQRLVHGVVAVLAVGEVPSKTPAMAAEITDHVWTMEELRLLRVPPWRQEAVPV